LNTKLFVCTRDVLEEPQVMLLLHQEKSECPHHEESIQHLREVLCLEPGDEECAVISEALSLKRDIIFYLPQRSLA
jgi:hypothetical protein